VWAILAVGAFMFIGSFGDSDQKPQNHDIQATSEPKPVLSVTAIKMASEYKANEVSADAKYKDQLVEISGTVDTIGKDIVDTPYISFETENPYEIINRIQCMFKNEDTVALSAVSKGQKIRLRGTVSGELGNIIVKGCKIID
jgi:hypothetical protein